MTGAYVRPHTGEYIAPNEDEWTWNHVQEMVSGTRGFYARDWPLQLGWNNVRTVPSSLESDSNDRDGHAHTSSERTRDLAGA